MYNYECFSWDLLSDGKTGESWWDVGQLGTLFSMGFAAGGDQLQRFLGGSVSSLSIRAYQTTQVMEIESERDVQIWWGGRTVLLTTLLILDSVQTSSSSSAILI